MKFAPFSVFVISMIASIATLMALPSHAAISIEFNPHFEFHKKTINNANGLRTRYFCDVTDQTKKSPTPYRHIPLEHITIQNNSIVFEQVPNGATYSIPRSDTRIDCVETIMR